MDGEDDISTKYVTYTHLHQSDFELDLNFLLAFKSDPSFITQYIYSLKTNPIS